MSQLPELPDSVDEVKCMIRGEQDYSLSCDDYYTRDQMLAMYAQGVASVKREPQWLPIESAPKDGERVLIWGLDFIAPSTAQWYGKSFRLAYELPEFAYRPTHWMPLPQPPTGSEGDGNG